MNELCKSIYTLKEENCKYVIVIFFDIMGFFYNLCWPSLLVELKKLNIHKQLWKVIENYFKDRVIEVETADGVVAKTPTRGCSQGSVLGPVSWNLAFQPCLDMLSGMQQVEMVVGYADDLAVVIKRSSRLDLETKANEITGKMTSWCRGNKLTISSDKTKYVLFKGSLNYNRGPIIKINGKSIKSERYIKYLGLILDEKLNFRQHTTIVKNKAVKIT